VPTVTSPLFKPYRARRQIKIIVNHQYAIQRNPIVTAHGTDASTTEVHVGCRLEEPAAISGQSADFTSKLRLVPKGRVVTAGKLVKEPEPNIMAGMLITGPWISKTHDEINVRRQEPA
jgi:hypothetical protein